MANRHTQRGTTTRVVPYIVNDPASGIAGSFNTLRYWRDVTARDVGAPFPRRITTLREVKARVESQLQRERETERRYVPPALVPRETETTVTAVRAVAYKPREIHHDATDYKPTSHKRGNDPDAD